MRLAPIRLLVLLCAACGPPRIADITSEGETSGSSTGSTSTGSTSTDDSTDTSSTDDGSPLSDTHFFVPEGEFIGGSNPCQPFVQDCPRGEKCVPYGSTGGWWDSSKCVPVLGEQTVGEPCTWGGLVDATDDCDATSFCWNAHQVEDEMVGTCHGFCTGTEEMPECPQGYECLLSSESVVTLCFPNCDPVAQDCSSELGCYWSGTAFICTATLELPGILPGQPCGYVNDCEAGSSCVDASVIPNCNGSACCGRFCSVGLGDAQCAAVPGTTCVPFWEQGLAPVGQEDVGICIVGP